MKNIILVLLLLNICSCRSLFLRNSNSEVNLTESDLSSSTSDHGFDSIIYFKTAVNQTCNAAHIGNGYFLSNKKCVDFISSQTTLNLYTFNKKITINISDLKISKFKTNSFNLSLFSINNKILKKLSTFSLEQTKFFHGEAIFSAANSSIDKDELKRILLVTPLIILDKEFNKIKVSSDQSVKSKAVFMANPIMFSISPEGVFQLKGIFDSSIIPLRNTSYFTRLDSPDVLSWIKQESGINLVDSLSIVKSGGTRVVKSSKMKAQNSSQISSFDLSGQFLCQSVGAINQKITLDFDSSNTVIISTDNGSDYSSKINKSNIDSIYFTLKNKNTAILQFEESPPILKLISRKKNTLEKLTCLRGF